MRLTTIPNYENDDGNNMSPQQRLFRTTPIVDPNFRLSAKNALNFPEQSEHPWKPSESEHVTVET